MSFVIDICAIDHGKETKMMKSSFVAKTLLVFQVSVFVVCGFAVSAVGKTCPTGKYFSTAAVPLRDDNHGCSCPDGYRKEHKPGTFGGIAICTHITCKTGDWFPTFEDWHNCSCPSGYLKIHKPNTAGNYAICAKAACPNETWFSTTGEYYDCKCASGLVKRYRTTFNEEAICTSNTGIENEGIINTIVEVVTQPLYDLYQGYFKIIASGATMRAMPDYVRNALKPYFADGTLGVVQYGASNQLTGTAMTDCSNIYFPSGSGMVNEINSGTVLNSSGLDWLLHELVHVEQCVKKGLDRSSYASMWWGQLPKATINDIGDAIRKRDLSRISHSDIHNRMPMEANAKSRALEIERKLNTPAATTRRIAPAPVKRIVPPAPAKMR